MHRCRSKHKQGKTLEEERRGANTPRGRERERGRELEEADMLHA